MYQSAEALKDAMIEIGMACDGGKDSLSMAATAAEESVMAPGNVVISAYVGCTDITKVLTPDIKQAGSYILHVDLSEVPCPCPVFVSMQWSEDTVSRKCCVHKLDVIRLRPRKGCLL